MTLALSVSARPFSKSKFASYIILHAVWYVSHFYCILLSIFVQEVFKFSNSFACDTDVLCHNGNWWMLSRSVIHSPQTLDTKLLVTIRLSFWRLYRSLFTIWWWVWACVSSSLFSLSIYGAIYTNNGYHSRSMTEIIYCSSYHCGDMYPSYRIMLCNIDTRISLTLFWWAISNFATTRGIIFFM